VLLRYVMYIYNNKLFEFMIQEAAYFTYYLELTSPWAEINCLDWCQVSIFFYYLVCEAIGTAATPGLLCQPQVQKQMECRLAGEPKFSEKSCPSTTFVHHTSIQLGLLNHTQAVPGLNLRLSTGYPDLSFTGFPQSLWTCGDLETHRP
jgi:hypothetical protein